MTDEEFEAEIERALQHGLNLGYTAAGEVIEAYLVDQGEADVAKLMVRILKDNKPLFVAQKVRVRPGETRDDAVARSKAEAQVKAEATGQVAKGQPPSKGWSVSNQQVVDLGQPPSPPRGGTH